MPDAWPMKLSTSDSMMPATNLARIGSREAGLSTVSCCWRTFSRSCWIWGTGRAASSLSRSSRSSSIARAAARVLVESNSAARRNSRIAASSSPLSSKARARSR